MKTNIATVLIAIAALCAVLPGSAPLRAALPGIPGVGGGGGGGGVDIGTVFDTYLVSYVGMIEGQASVAGALGLTELQGKYTAEAERLKNNKGKDLDATQKLDKDGQKQIAESMDKATKLDPDKQKLLVEGTAAYAVGAIKLSELIKQVKNVKKPGITDVAAMPKFKLLQTLPEYIKNVATVLPSYSKFCQKVGVQPDSKLADAMKAANGPAD